MADPPEHATRTNPETGCDNQPEEPSNDLSIVYLANAWNDQAEQRGGNGVFHRNFSFYFNPDA